MAVGTASLQDRLERWSQRLNNLTVSPLTRDYPDTQKQDGKRTIEAFESVKLPKDTQLAVKKLSGSSSSDFTVFLTAFVVLVARLTGDEDIAVGTSVGDDGRPFVLRVPISASETFTQLYAKVDKVRWCVSEFSAGVILTMPSRPSKKVPPISYPSVASALTSRTRPSPNNLPSSSDSRPTMPLPPRRSTLPTLLIALTW